ncbi:multidrug resistance-associated protein 1 [Aplysia californica]|uniref:ABC-type glutathione-S-conjugate transporter n=1 Tax=Aplysia californica TaxID=6500 RepID=A0ABM1AFH8_APLCA|nr:multidrug resistance-associated protein 1 [Aplysia californica]
MGVMEAIFQPLCGDEPLWDEGRLLNNTWPEFTACFQWTVMVWTPCTWLWLVLPVHIWDVRHRPAHSDLYRLPSNKLNIAKIFICLLLTVLTLLQVFVTIQNENHETAPRNALYVSCSVLAATYLLAAWLSRSCRRAGIASPFILFIFWLLNLVCHVPPVYSFVLLNVYEQEKTEFDIMCVSFGFMIIQFFLHFFSEKLVITDQAPPNHRPSPEIFASFPSRITFHWITGYIWRGYRRSLSTEDIWSLPEQYKSRTVNPPFEKHWGVEVERTRKKNSERVTVSDLSTHARATATERTHLLSYTAGSQSSAGDPAHAKPLRPSLFKVLVKTYAPELTIAFSMRLLADSIQFLLPILTNLLIEFVQNKDQHTIWHGYALVMCFFVVTFIYSVLFNQNSFRCNSIGMKVKTALVSAVYKKSLTMNNEMRRKFTVGSIVNLMAIDCQILQDVTSNIFIVVSAPFQICMAFYFLNDKLGVSFVAGVAVIVALIPLNARISVLAKRAQAEQLRVKDERLKIMNEILSGIKVLKLYAWETSFEDRIRSLRGRELKLLRSAAILNIINVFSWLCSPVLVTTTTFVTYIFVSSDGVLDSNTAFVSLILFNILSIPMNRLPNIITDLVSAHVSIGRLRKFLSGEDLDSSNVNRESMAEKSSFEGQVRSLRLKTYDKKGISISNGTFLWDRNMPPVLKNIDLNIPEGKLVAVVGQMGAGKSSLLSAILGEVEKVSGDVTVRGSMAYVPQQAWIQNMTVKQNILFDRRYHHSRYTRVIKACALQHDLEILIGGENAEIGEKGTNMSGGQKQRVSLARAVYYDADVYLFDDPLSAVDTHVGKHIFKNVISNSGMLKNKTRVLVTHGIHWLPMVDSIIVLHQGKIIQKGTYEELLTKDGPFAQFLRDYLLDDEEVDDPEIRYIRTEMWKKVDSVTSDGLTSADEDDRPRRRRLRRRNRLDSHTDSSKHEDGYTSETGIARHGYKLIEEEKSARGKVKGSVVWDFLRAFGICFAVSLICLLMVYQGVGVGASIWLSKWTDDSYLANVSLAHTDKFRTKTYTYLAVYSALGFVQAVCALAFVGNISLRMVVASKRLHDALLENILRQPMKFFDTTPLGRVINRFSRDVDMIDSSMARLVRMFFQQLFTVLSVLVVITYTTPVFIGAAMPIMLIYYLVQKFYVPSSRQLRRNESTTRSPVYSHFSETISGSYCIRAFKATERFALDNQRKVDTNNAFFYAFTSASRWIRIRLELLGNLIVLFAAWFAVVTDGLTGSLVGLSVSYALQVTSTLNELVQNSTQLESNVVSVERIVEYSKLPQEPAWKNPSKELDDDWPRRGDIVFHTYSTRYRPDLDLVLKNVSCHIEDGEKIGIVGRTGAGKSSMSMALFRMIESAGGSIIIDGVNIADIGLHDLRSRLTIIPQDPVLFSGTLRFNIDPFGTHTDDEIWATLENAQLKTFVSELPGGLSYLCEEGGQNLSVGQRQLICMTRSLMRRAKVLMLDEATAAVDLETDELIQQTIRHCFKECTVLTVAHRLNTIMDYDRIIVLDAGRISEFDTVEKLLENKESVFYSMVKEANLLPYNPDKAHPPTEQCDR